mgnify:CR=1 FL=1
MSWSLFKKNVIRKTNPNNNPNLTILDIAGIWSDEYDMVVKRGKDFINLESVQTGNTSLMKTLINVSLLKGLATPPGVNFSLVNEFGNGVKAYWVGAQMNPLPIPPIPAPGSIQNLAVNSNVAINPGVWPIYPPIKPAPSQETMLDMFIIAATIHLFSVGGNIQTTSLYPSTPSPIPGPGVIPWTGYLIPASGGGGLRNSNDDMKSDESNNPNSSVEDIGSNNPNNSTNTGLNNDSGNNFDNDKSLDDILAVSLPNDTKESIKSPELIDDLKKQLRMGGTKCE